MAVTDEEIVDAYLYLLGRFIVLRQENHDIRAEQVGYNVIKYNPLGAEAAEFVNPNLDVAYLEAWIAVDPDHAVVMNVPQVKDRYHTIQILDGWGEVITNVNQRTYPNHPYGPVAFALAGTSPHIPGDALRIDLPAAKAKIPLPGLSGHAPCTRCPTTTSSRTPTAGTSTPRCHSNPTPTAR